MNVAIPLFGTRVSPRFDCAQVVLVVEADDGQYRHRREVVFAGLAPHERINRLLQLGIDTLVCGGIDRWSAESLQAAGVKLFAFTTGEAEDALALLLEGSLVGAAPFAEMDVNVAGCFGRGRRARHMNRGVGGRGGQGQRGSGQGQRGKGMS